METCAAVTSVTTSGTTASADEVLPEEDELVEEDLLVEDVSIDGMCGVY